MGAPTRRLRILSVGLGMVIGMLLVGAAVLWVWGLASASAPLLILAAIGVVALLLSWACHRRSGAHDQRAQQSGHSLTCRRCGYDLAHVPHPRCPECGALRGFRTSATELGIGEDELRF